MSVHARVVIGVAMICLVSSHARPEVIFPQGEAGRQSDAFFDDSAVRTFKIQVTEPALTALNKDNRAYVRATVTEGGQVFKDAGVHLKGMGSFRPLNEKPSLVIKFDKYTPDQTYCGMTKLMLNNASQDGTYLAEWLGTQMFRDAGVPAPRVSHAHVEFNGRPLGLYVVIEAMNKEFLRRHFKSAKGNLYEAYLQDIDQRLDQDNGTDSTQADVKALLGATRVSDRSNRWERLNQVLDVDRYVSHLVVEMFTSHTDGYAMNRNNYRIYDDPDTGKFVFFGHGIDWAFANTGVSIEPPQASLVTRAVLQTPEGRRLFNRRRAELFTNIFRLEVLSNRVALAVAKLKAGAHKPDEARSYENCGNDMRSRLLARHRNIADQLAHLAPQSLPFDASGVARLTQWQARKLGGDKLKAEGTMDRGQIEGRDALHLRVKKGDGLLSWRAKVFLLEGRYRFEGQARTAHVAGLTNTLERGNGAGLRVSGEKRTQQLLGDAGWTPLTHVFEVPAGGEEKELLCELRACQGEAWFDMASLRLVRCK